MLLGKLKYLDKMLLETLLTGIFKAIKPIKENLFSLFCSDRLPLNGYEILIYSTTIEIISLKVNLISWIYFYIPSVTVVLHL